MAPNRTGCRPAFLAGLALSAALPSGAASIVWEAQIDGPGIESHVRAAAADGAGDLVVAGQVIPVGAAQCRTAKFTGASGAIAWQRPLAVAGANCEVVALSLDGAGNAIVASLARSPSGDVTGSRTSKYAAVDGALVWERPFGEPADGADEIVAIDADAEGNVFVTGRFVAGGDPEWRTIKYAAVDGAILWERAFDRGAASEETPGALALDAAGNPIVAGSSRFAGASPDLVTIKYDRESGAPSWTSVYPGPEYTSGRVEGIAIDGEGNVLVLGGIRAYASSLTAVLLTLKYAAGDGALRWSAVIDEVVPNAHGKYGMIAAVPAGDVVVAGSRFGATPPSDFDFRTVRYAGATGAVMWTRTFHGGNEYANALALDGDGNPVVAGQGGSPAEPDMAAVKYLAAGGDASWEHWYDGSGTGRGFATAVAAVPGAVFLAGEFSIPSQAPGLPRWQVAKVSDTPDGPRPVSLDFDADGKADFAFRHADGTTGIWLMDGAATASIDGIFNAGSGFEIVAVDDFDGNGTADLLWRLPEGHAVSLMQGSSFVATAGILAAGTGWAPAMTADFDGDGKADIALRHEDGSLAIAIMDGAAIARGFLVLAPGSGWSALRAGDFDGDGRADLVLRRFDGAHAIVLIDGFGVAASALLPDAWPGAAMVLLADFDGDGRKDILWAGPDGAHSAWRMVGTQVRGVGNILPDGSGWHIPLAADFDGDRREDVVVAHDDGRVGIWLMRGLEMDSAGGILGPGTGWGVAAARDTNGDGRADLLLRHESGVYAIGLVKGTAMPTAAGVVGPPWGLVP